MANKKAAEPIEITPEEIMMQQESDIISHDLAATEQTPNEIQADYAANPMPSVDEQGNADDSDQTDINFVGHSDNVAEESTEDTPAQAEKPKRLFMDLNKPSPIMQPIPNGTKAACSVQAECGYSRARNIMITMTLTVEEIISGAPDSFRKRRFKHWLVFTEDNNDIIHSIYNKLDMEYTTQATTEEEFYRERQNDAREMNNSLITVEIGQRESKEINPETEKPYINNVAKKFEKHTPRNTQHVTMADIAGADDEDMPF